MLAMSCLLGIVCTWSFWFWSEHRGDRVSVSKLNGPVPLAILSFSRSLYITLPQCVCNVLANCASLSLLGVITHYCVDPSLTAMSLCWPWSLFVIVAVTWSTLVSIHPLFEVILHSSCNCIWRTAVICSGYSLITHWLRKRVSPRRGWEGSTR